MNRAIKTFLLQRGGATSSSFNHSAAEPQPNRRPLWSAAALGCGDKSFARREEIDE